MAGSTLRRTPVQRRGEEQLRRLVDAAAEVIAESGAETLTTSLVAKRAGVSVGLVYRYFKDKDALLVAVLQRSLEGFDALLWAHSFDVSGEDWREQVANGVDLSADFVRDRELGFHTLWFSDVLTGAMVAVNRHHDASLAETLASRLAERDPGLPGRGLSTVMRVYLGIWDKGLEIAFTENPQGDRAILEETKLACIRYLEPFLGASTG